MRVVGLLYSPRLKNRRVRLLLSLFESPALCVMLTHLCEDLSVLCSLMHFAVTSASACVAPSSDLQVCSHPLSLDLFLDPLVASLFLVMPN